VAANESLAGRVCWDEKKGLFIVKVELAESYRRFRVEVIFRVFNHLVFPKNEDVVGKYLARYPQARPLYLVVRSLIHRVGLDDPGQSGINNFSLFLMVVAFCQKIELMAQSSGQKTHAKSQSDRASSNSSDPVRPSPQSSPSSFHATGDLLVQFLYFYGYSFDYVNVFICPSLPEQPLGESFFQVS
jgi:DNA polymerase sigma